jgi:DnaJ-class molecular chaperone
VISLADKKAPKQALAELQAILRKPYQDVCNICKGAGSTTTKGSCPKCKGSGHRLLRLL